MSRAVFEWIAASWKGDYSRKNGAIAACNEEYVVTSEREFLNALLTEATIPAMDSASKEAVYLTIQLPAYHTGQAPSPAAAPVLLPQNVKPISARTP